MIRLKVPAKINLYLRLTGKRVDGFNDICTVFQKIAFYDSLEAKKINKGCLIEIKGMSPCSTKDNLIYKAYQTIKKKAKFKGGVKFSLEKNIPFGAGLGGASADAAYALFAINKLYKLRFTQAELTELAKPLGADVALFLYKDSRMLGLEKGDVLLPLSKGPKLWVLLVVMEEKLSTADVYKAFRYNKRQISLTTISSEVIILSQSISRCEMSDLAKVMHNDLMRPAKKIMPVIGKNLNKMKKSGLSAVLMTGSGSTLFALFKDKKDAQQAAEKLDLYNVRNLIVCQTLD